MPSHSQILDILSKSKDIQRAKANAKSKSEPKFFASPEDFTPAELLLIPWKERWKLNLDQRGLPQGELELGRMKGAERMTWLVQYQALRDGKILGPQRVFFYSHVDYLGGPFTFLSNFFRCEFTVPYVHKTHVFTSVEQFYQFVKTCYMRAAPEKHVRFDDHTCSTLALCALVLEFDEPDMSEYIGRSARQFQSDKKWWERWSQFWENDIEWTLLTALRAKFGQNRTLQQLLLMTGDFELVEASSRDDARGIGYHASEAIGKKKWGANLLGKYLVQVRAELRESREEKTEAKLPGYSFAYWRFQEELMNERRYLKRRPAGAKLPDQNRPQLDNSWNVNQLKQFVEQWPAISKFSKFGKVNVPIHDIEVEDEESSTEQEDESVQLAAKINTLSIRGRESGKRAKKNFSVHGTER